MPDLPRLGVADDAVERADRSGTPAGSTRRSTSPARRATRSGAIAREHECYLAIPVNERDGGTVYNTLLLLRARRRAAREAPQARRDRRRAPRVGLGRRLDPPGDRHAVRPRRRADLLGELHAARTCRDVRAGHRRAPRADVGQLRRVAALDAAHRQGRPLLRARHHVVPTRGSDVPADLPGRDEIYADDDDWMSRGNTIIVDPYGCGARRTAHR